MAQTPRAWNLRPSCPSQLCRRRPPALRQAVALRRKPERRDSPCPLTANFPASLSAALPRGTPGERSILPLVRARLARGAPIIAGSRAAPACWADLTTLRRADLPQRTGADFIPQFS
eukprot:Hpha_TRINITY_DN29672_c0_g1::TRINITY_DN29672_c0_g1_i1::g.165302::m.165302